MAYPNNLKTGFDNDLSCLEKKELEINVRSSIMAFTEYAMKSASLYVEHSRRNIITVSDIKKGLMIEVFKYFNRSNLLNNVQRWRETIIIQDNFNEEYFQEEEYCDEKINNEQNFVCKCMNCIEFIDIESKWKNYVPNDELGKIMKNNIDKMV
tara:strand:- start:145 stop:603 length:459 start_codon:yes stop_codon:yes gene_type:complete